jgi:prolyl oligopeptidase
MRDRKQTTFDDFIAAADWLIANKYTTAQRLAIYGGSHGALTAGAVLTQRPDLCRAGILSLPVVDMLRYERVPAGRAWAQEYGSAANADQSKWLLAYSPYQHVNAGTKYPGVLLMADEDDAEVHPMHARKMAAALQATTASDLADHPILLRVDHAAGQDPQAILNLQLEKIVDQRLFLMWQLGML